MHPELVSKPRRRTGGAGADHDNDLTHPLLGDEPTLQLMPNPDDVSHMSHHQAWWLLSNFARFTYYDMSVRTCRSTMSVMPS